MSANFDKISIGRAAEWLVQHAKNAGLDIENFEHEITSDFKNHVLKRHGDAKKEEAMGQIAINQSDFANIPDIISDPDYMAIGVVNKKDQTILAYAKKMNDGTFLYFEEVLSGGKNKALRSKTMYKRKGGINGTKFINIVSNNRSKSLKPAMILKNLRDTGGHPSFATIKKSSAVANSTQPVNLNDKLNNIEK